MDREQAALNAVLEDYRVRSSELVSLTVEVNRWRSLYLVALIGAITWLIATDLPLANVFSHKAVLLFALSILNAIFAATQAWNSWAIHQNGRFCYEFLGCHAGAMTRFPFGVWDEWRRSEDLQSEGVDAVRRSFGRIERATTLAVSFCLVVAGAGFGGLSGEVWAVLVTVTVSLNLLVFWYALRVVPARIREMWQASIRRRCHAEHRAWRYGPAGAAADTQQPR